MAISAKNWRSCTAARLGVLAVLVFIAILDLYGRKLERGFPFLTRLVPYGGAALFLFILAALIARIARQDRRETARAVIIGSVLGVVGAAICETLVSFPIERVHFIKYALLAFSLFFSFPNSSFGPRRLLTVVGGCFLVGVLDESFQKLIPERIFALEDIAINWGGSITGTAIAAYFLRFSAVR